MNNSRVPFSKTQEQNQETLKGIVTQIENLEEKIPDLNKQVGSSDWLSQRHPFNHQKTRRLIMGVFSIDN